MMDHLLFGLVLFGLYAALENIWSAIKLTKKKRRK